MSTNVRLDGQRSLQEAGSLLFGRHKTLLATSCEVMAMPGDKQVCGIPNGCGDDAHNGCQPPESPQIPYSLQDSCGACVHAFGRRVSIGGLDPEDGIDFGQLWVPLQDAATESAVERSEPQRSFAVMLEHVLNALSTEAAGAIVQEDRSVRRRLGHEGRMLACGAA